MDELPSLKVTQLKQIYTLVDEIRSDEMRAAIRHEKAAARRVRVKLMRVAKLCKEARAQLLAKAKGYYTMDKYGVKEKEKETTEKLAETCGKCPTCDSTVENHGNVVLCPQCGSAPFEGEDDDKDE